VLIVGSPTGGSTIGAIASLVERYPEAFEGFGLEIGVDENETKDVIGVGRDGGGKSAGKVWEMIQSVASLVNLLQAEN
jgi:hypothetical protein